MNNVGAHGRLVVWIRGYTRSYPQRNVVCFDEPASLVPTAADCAKSLSLMPYSDGQPKFGRPGIASRWRDKLLPKAYSARESISTLEIRRVIGLNHDFADCVVAGGRCDLVLDVSRPEETDQGIWQDLWYAANTVFWMCVRQGKGGEATGLGMVEKAKRNERLVLIEGNGRYQWKFEVGFYRRYFGSRHSSYFLSSNPRTLS